MSSSTALLPKPTKDEHPIFLRVCHSPWSFISQKVLLIFRSIIAAYMFITLGFALYYEVAKQKKGGLIPFEFHNIVWIIQMIYHTTAAIWTFMHLYYPYHGGQAQTAATRVQRLFSPPHTHPTSNSRAFFSISYTAAISLPHAVTLIHWMIEVPHHPEPVKDIFTKSRIETFYVVSFFIMNSVIALIEVVVLSGIRRQHPMWAHSAGLTILQLSYVLWAYIGKLTVGRYAYWFFNFSIMPWQHVVVAIVAFVALAEILYAVNYGITGLRETISGTNQKSGYRRLPQ